MIVLIIITMSHLDISDFDFKIGPHYVYGVLYKMCLRVYSDSLFEHSWQQNIQCVINYFERVVTIYLAIFSTGSHSRLNQKPQEVTINTVIWLVENIRYLICSSLEKYLKPCIIGTDRWIKLIRGLIHQFAFEVSFWHLMSNM